MDNFDTRKWFKKQYLEEGMSDEEIQAIKRFENLSDDDKLKIAKIQAMMDRERSLKEDDLKEEEGFVEVGKDEIKMHLDQYRAGEIDGDDLANAIEEIVFIR